MLELAANLLYTLLYSTDGTVQRTQRAHTVQYCTLYTANTCTAQHHYVTYGPVAWFDCNIVQCTVCTVYCPPSVDAVVQYDSTV